MVPWFGGQMADHVTYNWFWIINRNSFMYNITVKTSVPLQSCVLLKMHRWTDEFMDGFCERSLSRRTSLHNAHHNECHHINPLRPPCRSLRVWFRHVTVAFPSPPLILSFVPPAPITCFILFLHFRPQPFSSPFSFPSLATVSNGVCYCLCVCLAFFVFPVILFLLQLNLSFIKQEVSQGFWWPPDNSHFTCLFVKL